MQIGGVRTLIKRNKMDSRHCTFRGTKIRDVTIISVIIVHEKKKKFSLAQLIISC